MHVNTFTRITGQLKFEYQFYATSYSRVMGVPRVGSGKESKFMGRVGNMSYS